MTEKGWTVAIDLSQAQGETGRDDTPTFLRIARAVSEDIKRGRLRAGDSLVLYSDGITEASNALGEEYGPTRLRQAVTEAAAMPAEAAARHILHSATGFVGGEKPHDDQSILVLRRTSA